MNHLRPLIDRLPARVRHRLARFIPAFDTTDAVGQDNTQVKTSIDDLPLPFDWPDDSASQVEATAETTDPSEQAESHTVDSPENDVTVNEDAGERFVAWLKASIEHETLPINTKKRAAIHTLSSGLLLTSPLIFQTFDPPNWRHVQRRFQKLRLHTQTPRGENIWTGYFDSGKRERLVNGLLILDAERVLGVTLPDPNPNLTLFDAEGSAPCV